MSHARAWVKLGDRRCDTDDSVVSGTTVSFGEPHGVLERSCPLVIVSDDVAVDVVRCSLCRCRLVYLLVYNFSDVVFPLHPWCTVLSVRLVLCRCVDCAMALVDRVLALLSMLLNAGRMAELVDSVSLSVSTLVSWTLCGRGALGSCTVVMLLLTFSTWYSSLMDRGHSVVVALLVCLTARDTDPQSRLVNCSPIAIACVIRLCSCSESVILL